MKIGQGEAYRNRGADRL